MVRVSGSVFLARRDDGDSERSLARLTCPEAAILASRAALVVGEWCRAAAREPAAPITTVSSPWGVWWTVRVSGAVGPALRSGADTRRAPLNPEMCGEVALFASDGAVAVRACCGAAARAPAAPLSTVSSPWGVWRTVRVSGAVGLALRSGADTRRAPLNPQMCDEAALSRLAARRRSDHAAGRRRGRQLHRSPQ